jgi:four helix bundle protein
MSFGSASELECQLLLSRDLGYLDQPSYEPLRDATIEKKRMLGAFITTLKAGR